METQKKESTKQGKLSISLASYLTIPSNGRSLFWDMPTGLYSQMPSVLAGKIKQSSMPVMFKNVNHNTEKNGGFKDCKDCDSGRKLEIRDAEHERQIRENSELGHLKCEACGRTRFIGLL